jgi:hypothetical protein
VPINGQSAAGYAFTFWLRYGDQFLRLFYDYLKIALTAIVNQAHNPN